MALKYCLQCHSQTTRLISFRPRVGTFVSNPRSTGPLQIQPVLLHGDLWSGNVGVERLTNLPCIFDPSSFYGHNEADLAIARIFGGFPPSFFTTYHAHRPESEPVDQYTHRIDLQIISLNSTEALTQLLQGSYAESAKRKMTKLLEARL